MCNLDSDGCNSCASARCSMTCGSPGLHLHLHLDCLHLHHQQTHPASTPTSRALQLTKPPSSDLLRFPVWWVVCGWLQHHLWPRSQLWQVWGKKRRSSDVSHWTKWWRPNYLTLSHLHVIKHQRGSPHSPPPCCWPSCWSSWPPPPLWKPQCSSSPPPHLSCSPLKRRQCRQVGPGRASSWSTPAIFRTWKWGGEPE